MLARRLDPSCLPGFSFTPLECWVGGQGMRDTPWKAMDWAMDPQNNTVGILLSCSPSRVGLGWQESQESLYVQGEHSGR